MLPNSRVRAQPRGMDYWDSKKKNGVLAKVILAGILIVFCIFCLKQSNGFTNSSQFSHREPGVVHVLVTGGAGYIGSHAALRLLKDSYRVTIVDNLSRGNLGAVKVLQELFPEPGRLQFLHADLGDAKVVNRIFSENAFDAVMHFAAVAYVGESTMDPLRYYHNITSNTLVVLEAMAAYGVKTLIYSSTCATYGEPEKMPITENTPQAPINPYGKAKKMAEDIILDFSRNSNMAVMILRYFNVIGSDPEGRLGEFPRPELREHGRISGACFDAARGIIAGLKVKGTDYNTPDGTCIRDYIDVTDLVDAHVKALHKAAPRKVGIYNLFIVFFVFDQIPFPFPVDDDDSLSIESGWAKMGSESEPAKLLLPYLQRADELQKHEPLVAYYCRLYAMERGLKIPPKDRTKTTNALLVSLMNQLEKDKKSLKLGNDDSLYLEGFASNVFSKADKQDRAGRADLNTAKTFYAASLFFEIINQFGELQPDLEQKQKYAVWKAADIRKALMEGRKPEPGPPGGENDISSSPVTLNDAGHNENLRRSESFAGSQPGFDTSSRAADDTYTHQNSSYAPSSSPSYPTSDYPAHDFSSPQAPTAPSPPPSSPPPPLPTNRPENTVYHQTYQHAQAFPSDQNYPSNHMDPTSYNYANFQFYPSFHESSLPVTTGNYPPSHPGFDGSYSQPPPGPELTNYPVAPTYNTGSKGEIDSRKTSQSAFSFSNDVNYKPAPEKISEAHKAAKFAVGALAFDDVPVAVDFLKQALELLTKPSVGQ